MAQPGKSHLGSLIVALVLMAGVGWYGYSQYTDWSDVKSRLMQADTVLLELEQTRGKIVKEYQGEKKDYIEQVSANQEKIRTIFPYEEDLTGLTRLFDKFAFQNHFKSNPFFVTQLSYSDLLGNEDQNFRVLPITMTVETSERNLYKFIEYVENSGSLESGVRLLAINGITLQKGNDDDSTLRVQLSIHAYLQL